MQSTTSGKSSQPRERSPLKTDPPDGGASPSRRPIVPLVTRPGLSYERELLLKGARTIAGIDEAGRGALAGPVAAAAVILPAQPLAWFDDVDDSKKLSAPERERLAKLILQDAVVGLAMTPASRIDAAGIAAATREAMLAALNTLGSRVDGILVDGSPLPIADDIHQLALTRGDQVSISVSAASIIAKVARDEVMRRLDAQHSGYGLARNKGYGTAKHLEALRKIGPSVIHRRTFRNVENVAEAS